MVHLGNMKHVGRDRHIKLLSGRAHPELAHQIADYLKLKLTPVDLKNFANGEISCRIGETLRGNDVFILQTHAPDVHEALMEQLLMIDTAKRASARSITAVCPLLSYARQDRKSRVREPIGARLVIDMLSVAGADRIMSVDLHSGQVQGFFDGPFDHLIAMSLFKKYIKKQHFGKDLVMVSPDAGRVKLTERYSSALGCEIAIIHKHRSIATGQHSSVEARHLIGKVNGKVCVIIDDMIDTAGTICAAANLLKEKGATAVYGIATHGILSGPALESIRESAFEKVIVTNTVPPKDLAQNPKIEVLSVAPMIADAIAAVAAGRSVSALFEGLNQM